MPHQLGGFQNQAVPFADAFGAQLPRAVVFVADGPVPDPVGLAVSVFRPEAGILSLILQVAVFHPVAHFLRRACAGVCADVGLAPDPAAQGDIFVRAEQVGVLHPPAFVEHRGAFRPHGLFPVIAGHETPAGPPKDGHPYSAQGLQHVGPEAVLVGEGAAGIKDAAVDLPVKVFDELTVDQAAAFLHNPSGP